jgi:hypothetical protein
MLRDRPLKKHKTEASVFELICQLAVDQDAARLQRLIDAGYRIDIRHGVDSPIMRLAKQGEQNAVNFLIQFFNGSVLEAVCGYVANDFFFLVSNERIIETELPWELSGSRFTFEIIQSINLLGGLLLNDNFSSRYHLSNKPGLQTINDFVAEHVAYLRSHIGEPFSLPCDDSYCSAYALGYTGNINQVEWMRTQLLISDVPDHEAIVSGYIRGGYHDLANAYMGNVSFALNQMAFLYAKSGKFDDAGDLLRRGADPMKVSNGLVSGRHLSSVKNIMRMLASTNSDAFKRLAETFIQSNDILRSYCFEKVNVNFVILKSAKLRKIMHDYQISFDAALALTTPGVREWILQCKQLQMNRPLLEDTKTLVAGLPSELYYQITFIVVGLSRQETEKLLTAVHRTLFAGVVQHQTQKYTAGFFADKAAYLESIDQAEQRFIARLI